MDEQREIEVVSRYLFHYTSYSLLIECNEELVYGMYAWPELPCYSESTHSIVLHYCDMFQVLFQASYETRINRRFSSKTDYQSYSVANCKRFIDQDFGFLEEEFGEMEQLPYFLFLMSAAFIIELEDFCSRKNYIECFCSGGESECLVMVYDRYLSSRFPGAGGWTGFKDYCDLCWARYESVPNYFGFRIMGLPEYGKTICTLRNRIHRSVGHHDW